TASLLGSVVFICDELRSKPATRTHLQYEPLSAYGWSCPPRESLFQKLWLRRHDDGCNSRSSSPPVIYFSAAAITVSVNVIRISSVVTSRVTNCQMFRDSFDKTDRSRWC